MLAVAGITPVYAQEVAADSSAWTVEETTPVIVVVGTRQPMELRPEWREPEVLVEEGLGVRRFSYTIPLATFGNAQFQFHREWSLDRPGINGEAPERDDDGLRFVCPLPLTSCFE